MSYDDDYDSHEEMLDHYANEYDRRRDEQKGGDFADPDYSPPDRAQHPNRQVGRKG